MTPSSQSSPPSPSLPPPPNQHNDENDECHQDDDEEEQQHGPRQQPQRQDEAGSAPPREQYAYIFGFGSIMNTSTHATWQRPSSSSSSSSSNPNNGHSHKDPFSLPGAVAVLKKSFGCTRSWNFRSSTGFTALGVTLCPKRAAASESGSESESQSSDDSEPRDNHQESDAGNSDDEECGSDINGVLFQIPLSALPDFDRREAGYRRVSVPLRHLRFLPEMRGRQQTRFCLRPSDPIYLYVPLPSHALPPDEHHPLLQSYVDAVLQGCLEWGDLPMAERFVRTTGGWSPYFLNDTPSSRRPWMFRKQYDVIDRLLERYSDKTHYGERRHPEEFAMAFHRRMRGLWGLPPRNVHFTGREDCLEEMAARLERTSELLVAGMGGLGKTQLCTEYCYRRFPGGYGLVVWLNAESADSLVADYKQLLRDWTPMEVPGSSSSSASPSSPSPSASAGNGAAAADKSTEEIIAEVKSRLFRSRVPWLLVFDNVEHPDLSKRFLPRGAGTKGHVLLTARHAPPASADRTLLLGCFPPSESVQLLARIAPRHVVSHRDAAAARSLVETLGNLPLALGTAAAYMRRCDVPCAEYLERYAASEGRRSSSSSSSSSSSLSAARFGESNEHFHSVASSLALSVNEIEKENPTACRVLRLLSFLGPDLITKAVIRNLLCEQRRVDAAAEGRRRDEDRRRSVARTTAAVALGIGASGALGLVRRHRGRPAGVVAATAISAAALLYVSRDSFLFDGCADNWPDATAPSMPNSFSSFEYEQADLVWDILKSFSLISVKEGKGTIHRLMSQAMRYSQSDEDARGNVTICIDAMRSMWTFKPERPDTWKESQSILEHVKSVAAHSLQYHDLSPEYILRAGQLSKEAGVFSAMSLNAFVEAQASLEMSLKLLDIGAAKGRSNAAFQKAKAETLHELGRVLRYQANYSESEQSLREALQISNQLNTHRKGNDPSVRKGIADTLHELGVLEVKKHNLDTAAVFLQQSLDMRRSSDQCTSDDTHANCAATLHQLAAIHVARKPPSLEKAKTLLQESLSLCQQIGQRAATLKQLARVSIRQGFLDKADTYLEHALELYLELYGDNKLHINIAAVKFQQGALALQREQLEEAWNHFSECLRIRRHVYAYARPVGSREDENPIHLEVSCVLHELGCVGFSQKRYSRSMEVLRAEHDILEKLEESTTARSERLHQARLTNLTWLRKCAKELGQDDEVNRLVNERTAMKKRSTRPTEGQAAVLQSDSVTLQWKAMECRALARTFALEKQQNSGMNVIIVREKLMRGLDELLEEISMAPQESMRRAAAQFRETVLSCIDKPVKERRISVLKACDELRDVLRAHGLQVSDSINSNKKKKKT